MCNHKKKHLKTLKLTNFNQILAPALAELGSARPHLVIFLSLIDYSQKSIWIFSCSSTLFFIHCHTVIETASHPIFSCVLVNILAAFHLRYEIRATSGQSNVCIAINRVSETSSPPHFVAFVAIVAHITECHHPLNPILSICSEFRMF